jgi:Tfp pilus assembly protein PilO
LAQIGEKIPGNPALPSLIRDLSAAGRKVGVTIDSMAPSAPVTVTAPASTGVVGAAPAAPKSGATAAAAPTSVLYQVPLALKVTGSYFELEQFLNKLEGLKRSMLVSGFSVTPVDSAGTDAAEGDLSLALTGRVFLSQDAPATTTAPVVPTTAH